MLGKVVQLAHPFLWCFGGCFGRKGFVFIIVLPLIFRFVGFSFPSFPQTLQFWLIKFKYPAISFPHSTTWFGWDHSFGSMPISKFPSPGSGSLPSYFIIPLSFLYSLILFIVKAYLSTPHSGSFIFISVLAFSFDLWIDPSPFQDL